MSALVLILIASQALAASACKKVKGKFALQAFAGPECTSAVGICATGDFSGDLAGTSVFIGSALIPSADTPVTVSGYDHDLKLWIEYQGDVDVAAVETTHILAYLNHLRTDYVRRRITGNNDKKLSPKTVYNLYISVASFFTWASREFQINNPVKGVPRPRVPEDALVDYFCWQKLSIRENPD